MADEWTLRASLRTARGGLASASTGGLIYAIGGFTSGFGEILKSVEVHDPKTSLRTTVADMRIPRGNPGAASLDGLVYALGGFHTPGSGTDRAEVFDPKANSWTEIERLPTKLTGLGAVGFDGRIFTAGGGAKGDGPPRTIDSVHIFDPRTNTWTSDAAPMPTARELLKMTELDGLLYAIGGVADGTFLKTVERFNPAANAWDTVAPMGTARGNPGVTTTAGRIFVVGGAGGTPAASVGLPSTEMFDPQTDTWQPLGALLPVGRGSLSAESGPGHVIFAVGGFIPPGPSASDRIEALKVGP